MSARSVCSGTRPSWYPSVRAISAPPSRPAVLILIPCAPIRIALCTARFMARRKEMRCVSWCATLSPTSCASSSGRLISSTLMPTSFPVSCASSSRSLSTSAPRLPITTPGRPVCTVTVTLPGLRFRLRRSRLLRRRRLDPCFGTGHANLDVARPLQNRRAAAHGRRREPLQRLPFVDHGIRDAQAVGIERRVVALRRLLRVRHRGLQDLIDLPRPPLLGEGENRIPFRDGPAADQIDHEAHLARRLPHPALNRSSFHSLLLLLLGAALGTSFSGCGFGLTLRRRALGAVAAEQPRRGELAQLVAHHVLGDVDGDELVPVVHREGVAHEVGRDRAAPRPGLEHLLLVPLVQDPDLHHQ